MRGKTSGNDTRNAGEVARCDDFRKARRRELRPHRFRLIVTVLDDERGAWGEAFARAGDDAHDRGGAVAAGRERALGLEPDVAFAQMRITARRRTAGCWR